MLKSALSIWKESIDNEELRRNYEMGKQKTQTYKKEYDKRTEERGKSGGGTCKGNDPAWYNHNPELVNAAANLFFSDPLGNSVDDGGNSNPMFGDTYDAPYDRIPGILSIGVIPTPGMASDANSVVNVAANNIYSYVRHANSGHSNYNAPDLMMYITAMDSLYSMLAHIIRIYGVINYYDAMNKYAPDSLLLALGVLPEEYGTDLPPREIPNVKLGQYLRSNKANILTWINVMITKLSSRAIPGNMDLFARHAFMYSGVWKDSANIKSQLYAYVPEGFWRYSGYTDSKGGECIWEPYRIVAGPVSAGVRGLPFTKLQAVCERMTEAVLADEDMGIMSGDILKVYGDSGIYKFSMVPQEFEIVPKYDESVLAQIENTTLCGELYKWQDQEPYYVASTPTLKQDVNTNLITFNVELAGPEPALKNSLINCRFDNPTPMDTLYHSRATTAISTDIRRNASNVVMGFSVKPLAFGTEVCTTAEIYLMRKKDNVMHTYISRPFTTYISAEATEQRPDAPGPHGANFSIFQEGKGKVFADAYLMDQFDWHPILRPVTHLENAPNGVEATAGPLFGDIDNYATITPDVLRRIHEVAVISLYNLPSQG